MTDNEKFPGGGPAGSVLTPITGIVHGNKKKRGEEGRGGVLSTTFQGH